MRTVFLILGFLFLDLVGSNHPWSEMLKDSEKDVIEVNAEVLEKAIIAGKMASLSSKENKETPRNSVYISHCLVCHIINVYIFSGYLFLRNHNYFWV